MKFSLPLGVDVLEFRSASTFYRRHASHLPDFLTQTERRYIQRSKNPSRMFAKIMAAKEAVFKAGRRSWMGRSGFKAIELRALRSGNFTAVKGARFKNALITFQYYPGCVVALCAVRPEGS